MYTNRKCEIVCFNSIISNKPQKNNSRKLASIFSPFACCKGSVLTIYYITHGLHSIIFFKYHNTKHLFCCMNWQTGTWPAGFYNFIVDNMRLGAFTGNKNFSRFDLLQKLRIPLWCFCIRQKDPMRLHGFKIPQQPLAAVCTLMSISKRSVASLSFLSVAFC